MIRKAKYDNFKGLKSVEVSFDKRFTVLVGPNGSGKTSVLQGIELVIGAWSDQPTLSQLMSGLQPLHSLGSIGSQQDVRLQILDEQNNGFGVSGIAPTPNLQPRSPLLSIHKGKTESATIGAQQQIKFGPVLRPHYRSAEIAKPSITQATPPPVTTEGGGLPSLLGYLKLRDDELFDRIEEHFCRVIPNVRKLRVDRSQTGGSAAGERLLFDTTFATKVPADQMSDGTLYILALIVAILGPHRPKTLLIDDIDLRLHPKAQYELVTLLKQFLNEFLEMQIIATSHSPYVLDKLEPDEVRVTGLAGDGSVVVARLEDHPDFAKWKTSMSPGEFWSHTGEEWLKRIGRSAPTP
jgi:predicted ATPase